MPITTREQLKSHIHSIHDYIRNSGAGYSMTAMKIFIFFYGLKLIEPHLQKLNFNITPFTELVQLAKKKKANDILCKIIDTDNGTGIIYDINKLDSKIPEKHNLKEIIYYRIPEDLKEEFYIEIIKLVNQIPINNTVSDSDKQDIYDVDVSGKLYEYFIGRDQTAISELGAYFTDRHITDFCINTVNPELENNNIPSFIDPFGGSGGFTLKYIMHFINNYELTDKFWKTNKNNIYHFDMSHDVIKITGLEFFSLTHELPDMKSNFIRTNTFKYNFDNKFNYVFSNGPFGGDSNKGSLIINDKKQILLQLKSKYYKVNSTSNKTEWIHEWAKTQYNKELKELNKHLDDLETRKVNFDTCSSTIKDFCDNYDNDVDDEFKLQKKTAHAINDKESAQLILFMAILNTDGTACVVLKEGVFFDNKYANIRKCLIDKFNVYKIVSVPADVFEHTCTKTSILFFKNNGKTTNIQFTELIIDKELEDIYEEITKDNITELQLIKAKDKITSVTDKVLATASYNEVSAPTLVKDKNKYYYSLSYKKYVKDNDIKCSDDYELIKLGDMCDIQKGYAFKMTELKIEQNGIPIIKSTNIQNGTIDDKNLISIKQDDKYNNFELKKDDIIISFVGTIGNIGKLNLEKGYLNQNAGKLYKFKNLTYKKYIFNFLPLLKTNILSLTRGGSTVDFINPTDILNKLKIPIPKSEDKLKEWVQKLSKPYDKLQEYKETLKELEHNIQEEIKRICNEEECIEQKLGDVCEINNNNITREHNYKYIYYLDIANATKGNINSLQHIELKDAPTRAKRIITENDIVIGTVRPSQEHYAIINKAHYVNNLIASTGYAVITPTKINNYYCYYQITNKQAIDYYVKMSEGSGYPAVGFDVIANYKIKIPKDTNLLDKLDIKFKELEELQELIKKTEVKYNKVLQELKEDIIIKNTDTNIVNEIDTEDKKSNNTSVDNDDVSTEQSKKTKRKSKVK